MKFRHFITMQAEFDTDKCLQRLAATIDPEKPTLFSLSGYEGSKPVIGWIDGYQFYLHKQRYWFNSFAPLFYGNFLPAERGIVIEGYFDTPRWTKWFLRLWLAAGILLGGPFLIGSILDLVERRATSGGDVLIGFLVPPCFILFGFLIPKIGLWLGIGEESFILEYLQRTFLA